MRSRLWFACLVLATATGGWAGSNPVAFRLASLPASAEPGQKLVLCAANIGTGSVDVTLEFINVKTGALVTEKIVKLESLRSGATAQPCLATETPNDAAPHVDAAMSASFATGDPASHADDGEALLVGVAMVRKPLLSFREAQVTASIQVRAPDAYGAMRTVQIIPLGRTTHPGDGAPVNAPTAAPGGHHK